MNIFANLKFLVDFLQKTVQDAKVGQDETIAIEKNIYHRGKLNWDHDLVLKEIGSTGNVDEDTVEFVNLVKKYQEANGLTVDGIVGPSTYAYMRDVSGVEAEEAVKRVFDMVIVHESGGNYSAMNRDGEFRGLFDKTWQSRHGHPHPASGKIHIGLSFGIIQFTQDGGSLGKLLDRCYKKNPGKFRQIMGETSSALLEVVNAKGPSGLSSGQNRSARVQPVPVRVDATSLSPVDIWESPWVGKFDKFGKDPEFQAVQRELALDEYLRPVLPFLKERGMTSEKSVACALDGCVHRGVGGFRTLIRNSGAKTEKEILTYLGKLDKRFGRIVKSNLSEDVWKGWMLYE